MQANAKQNLNCGVNGVRIMSKMLCQVVEYTSYRWSNVCEGVIVHCCACIYIYIYRGYQLPYQASIS